MEKQELKPKTQRKPSMRTTKTSRTKEVLEGPMKFIKRIINPIFLRPIKHIKTNYKKWLDNWIEQMGESGEFMYMYYWRY